MPIESRNGTSTCNADDFAKLLEQKLAGQNMESSISGRMSIDSGRASIDNGRVSVDYGGYNTKPVDPIPNVIPEKDKKEEEDFAPLHVIEGNG